MITNQSIFDASDGAAITIHSWVPNTIPKGIILLAHGMAEYARRYDYFADKATEQGYAVYAPDLRGHGETAGCLKNLGYLADHNGFVRVALDIAEITVHLQHMNPDIPVFLMGHSFGSFISQYIIETHGELFSGCILSGTRGPDPFLVIGGSILAALVSLLRGKKHPSPFLTQVSFGSYNAHITNPASFNSWLSRDECQVAAYDESPWSGFDCTAGFYRDLMKGLSIIHRKKMMPGIPKSLPILCLSGSEDPVSSYGKTVTHLVNIYRSLGITDLSYTLFEGGRHEMLNEINREAVSTTILQWIDNRVHGSDR